MTVSGNDAGAGGGSAVAFLRGMNLGNRRITNDELRSHFESAGFANVVTYRASGNVIFDASGGPQDGPESASLESAIEVHLADCLGYAVDTHVRRPAELEPLLDLDGIADAEGDGFKAHVVFLKTPVGADAAERLADLEGPDDRFRVLGREVIWLRRGGMARAPISTADLESALGTARQTMRTLGTVRGIVEKARA